MSTEQHATDEILSDAEILRYSRQISIKSMDFEGQEKLKLAKVLIIGAGGLGCAASQYLAVAGAGSMTLVDFDTVEISNLQRQVLHQDANVGQPKVESAKQSLVALNPHIHIETINAVLDDHEIDALVEQHSIIMDCTDNVAVREQLNQSCFKHKKPLISAAAIRMEGMVTVFDYQTNSPCYHCFSKLFGEQQLSCVESGILAPVVGMIGCLQAVEAIKVIANMGTSLAGRILMIDAMTMEFREMKLPKMPQCKVCS
ncbi:molybdopterin-synthase adenylyltransferase MoeB [Shewanella fidelis]|uniref:Molybdopterin-synthase adenylyltransferase n=1 Tax=Shewanella fidelis TaxID=173509 RepID=A0AAW8NU02_9GAMM|nr:molybdopterin-synthase adenylyltransferase MoeB [Shewanella fidelis]MDR8525975.1 molybdopterin-synthase adenylyltransferase MoeB [Shewanella fidelis]MDW4813837.1 molybdopterin-synthase adenylyltransferase MoeB [Shewanella fidelis]MDW4817971.1 molybdopterin-synthase adenylyltransferase MoeB [Shewanella fidelis]MDW4822038.1 molybdopterin-synthase adenylyltransferase MoeB [Shewanella fidelis]MDW4826203.1 molybdopterin-synthase adenylyltransferase MoeB [Shewanella fidelis]